MELVTIKDVTKNERNWYEVSLENDERVLATKDRKLADAANAAVGNPVEVDVRESKNGKFTNYFLNSVGDTKGDDKPAVKKAATSAPKSAQSQDQRQKDIDASWAFGRATELLIASDVAFSYPLDAETLGKLELTADALLESKQKLAGG